MTAPRIRGSPYRHRTQLPMPYTTGRSSLAAAPRPTDTASSAPGFGLTPRARGLPRTTDAGAGARLSRSHGIDVSFPSRRESLDSAARAPRRRLHAAATGADEPGRFVVDATWGTITPITLAPGVRTVGELEVVAHIEAGLPLIDTRLPKYVAAGTIPTARAVPHTETADRLNEFDDGVDTVLFCNGPQCAATPAAIRTLFGRWPPRGAAALLPRRDPRLGHARPAARARGRARSAIGSSRMN